MTGHRILIVEDEMIVQMHLERIVTSLGHTVTGTAASMEEAARSAEQQPPELVLMDIRLAGGGDGVDAARALRERYGCTVVFVTAYADAGTVERAQDVIPAGYIVKPFTGAEVRAAITSALTTHRQQFRPPVREPPALGASAGRSGPWVERPFGPGTRLMVYSHDTFGLGHLRRCLKLIGALSARHPGLSILLVTGSPMAHRYHMPPGVDYVKLPAVRKVAKNGYSSRSLSMSDEGIHALRSSLILRTVRDYDPHALLVDHSPTGMRGELMPTLEWLEHESRCTRILGLRDIIDEPAAVIGRWRAEGTYDVLRRHYDQIAVYGAADVYDTVERYELPDDVAAKTSFVNYVTSGDDEGAETRVEDDGQPTVVVTIGGGDGGAEAVIGPFLTMLGRYRQEVDFRVELLTGPLMSPDLAQRFQSEAQGLPVDLKSFVAAPAQVFRRAALVVATAGYNTTTELLAQGRRAILIPRVVHRQEQLIRARRMEELGLVTCLHPEDVTPEALLARIREALDSDVEPLTRGRELDLVPLDGAERFVDLCSSLSISVREPTGVG